MKRIIWTAVILGVLLIGAVPVFAAGNSTGGIRISPALPVMVQSPATFETWLQPPPASPSTDPNIVLVMTKACYDELSGNVDVTWTGGSTSFAKNVFTAANTGYVPPSGTTDGGRYTVASLQDHIGVPHSENVYYVYGPFLAGPLTQTHQTFTVTFSSTHARMLVYVIAKSNGSTLFNQKVPPTIPGFVVPEMAPVLLTLASFGALTLYAVKRKKK